jgi:transposase-like protein
MRASGRSAAKVAAELGIRPPLLYRWARTERVPDDATGGGGKPRRSLEELEAAMAPIELARLRLPRIGICRDRRRSLS